MQVSKDLCVGCKMCVPYCIMGAISIKDGKAEIDQDLCVECNVCIKSGICKREAFVKPKLTWPRELREQYSDPRAHHPKTNMGGRGTEEVKTNDVTGRVRDTDVGLAIEMGRPGVGTTFADAEKVAMALTPIGIHWEEYNPITGLMDSATGKFREDVLNERVLSCILEFVTPIEKLEQTLRALQEVTPQLDSVYSLCYIAKYAEDGSLPGYDIIKKLGYSPRQNAKHNLGMGRPLFEEQ
ncbi:MAG: indolepyruvate ferredoxin oxidoreductase subunit alpha [Christensenellales bacterium]|jgi:hypothetical protein